MNHRRRFDILEHPLEAYIFAVLLGLALAAAWTLVEEAYR